MKKNLFKIVLGVAVIATSFSSCTKEQTALNLLHGTWTLEEAYDNDGDLIETDPTIIESRSSEVTFFNCNGKDNEPCTGAGKTVTNYVNPILDDDISTYTFSYEVHDKSILLMGGTYYEIEELSKKDLTIISAESPNEKWVYSKNK